MDEYGLFPLLWLVKNTLADRVAFVAVLLNMNIEYDSLQYLSEYHLGIGFVAVGVVRDDQHNMSIEYDLLQYIMVSHWIRCNKGETVSLFE